MQSIREHSVTDEELGMYWRDLEHSWWWYPRAHRNPGLMIEAFDEVSGAYEAAAISGHGNFLQWGYSASPSEMTPAGGNLFVNCLHYIPTFDGKTSAEQQGQ